MHTEAHSSDSSSRHGPKWSVRFSSPSEEAFPLTRQVTVCGRQPACDVVLQNSAVARRHFAIHQRSCGCYLLDLNSSCGSFLRFGDGGNNGPLRAESEIDQGTWTAIGLTPLRERDVFGHPACWLTLVREAPIMPAEWLTGSNSQAMLLALRDSPFAGSVRLRRFIDSCFELLSEHHRDEAIWRHLRDHPDTWSAAAGLARFVVALATSTGASNDELNRELDAAESALCRRLRECFVNPVSR